MSVDSEISDIENNMIRAAVPASPPVFVHMLGIPGSGKSSFLNVLQTIWQTKTSVSLLGFDQVMQAIPSYQNMTDKIGGFEQLELPARAAGYRILDELLQKRAHILFDNGGSAESHPDLLRQARDDMGYRLAFVSIRTPIEVARSRVDARAVEIGQHTPLHYLEERQAKLDRLMTVYRTMTPYFYEIDNNHGSYDDYISAAQSVSFNMIKDLGL